MQPIRVKDGETISVIVELTPSVFDPAGTYRGLGQSYRVVANASSNLLELVPLLKEAKLLRDPQ